MLPRISSGIVLLVALAGSPDLKPQIVSKSRSRPRVICPNCWLIESASGGQTGLPGMTLAPLVFRVTSTSDGSPVPQFVFQVEVVPPLGAVGTQLSSSTAVEVTIPPTEVFVSTDNDGVATVQLTLGSLPGDYPVTASCLGCIGTTLKESAAQPAIKIVLQPPPPGDDYVISAAPMMPIISASAQVVNVSPDPTSNTVFTWTAHLTTNEAGGAGKLVTYDQDILQNVTTQSTAAYVLRLASSTVFRGGDLTLTVTATVNGNPLSAQTPSGLAIIGTNPARTDIQTYITNQVALRSYYGLHNDQVTDALQRMACRESGQIQFDGAPNGGQGVPYVTTGNDIGIMQLNQASPDFFMSKPEVVFNWQTNISSGTTTYQSKVKAELGYPIQVGNDNDPTDPDSYQFYLMNTVNPARIVRGLSPITSLPAPPFALLGPLGSNPPNQLLEAAVRAYNGYGANSGPFNIKYLHEFVPNTDFLLSATDTLLPGLPANPNVWMRACSNPGAGMLYGPVGSSNCYLSRDTPQCSADHNACHGDPIYVNNVAANTPQCPNGSQGN